MKDKKEIYKELQNEWIKLNNIKVGDSVKVLRIAKDYEDGWGMIWVFSMDKNIGKTFKINSISTKNGIQLGRYGYHPFFILEKIEEEVFYHVGQVFEFNNTKSVFNKEKYALFNVAGYGVVLMTVEGEDFKSWDYPKEVKLVYEITEEEFKDICDYSCGKFKLVGDLKNYKFNFKKKTK